MKWTDTKDAGFVNLEFVRRIAHRRDGTRHLLGDDDRVIAELWNTFDEEQLRCTIVPAMTPMMALVVAWVKPNEHEPTGIWAEDRLIIAWAISDMGATPIIAGDKPASNQDVLIIHQDGSCEESCLCTHSSREAAIESIRKEERWKRP